MPASPSASAASRRFGPPASHVSNSDEIIRTTFGRFYLFDGTPIRETLVRDLASGNFIHRLLVEHAGEKHHGGTYVHAVATKPIDIGHLKPGHGASRGAVRSVSAIHPGPQRNA